MRSVRSHSTGESKLTTKQNIEYVRQLCGLYLFKFGPLIVLLPLLLVAIGITALFFLALAVRSRLT
jgi:hypothetical protein